MTTDPAIAQRYHVRHVTRYAYTAPVSLHQTTVRLQPRTDAQQRLVSLTLHCKPRPARHACCSDLYGNLCHWFWFENEHDRLELTAESVVDALCENAFDFVIVDPGVEKVPVTYAPAVGHAALHYRQRETPDPAIDDMVRDILQRSGPGTLGFLWELTTELHRRIAYEYRPDGMPRPPAQTLAAERGSCRDAAVLFVDACRVVGLAARFVSGYAYDAVGEDQRELHAWAEVYLPGGGWKGYDPTIGLAVSNRHLAVAASPEPGYAAPFTGSFTGPPVDATLTFDLQMQQEPFAFPTQGDAVFRWG